MRRIAGVVACIVVAIGLGLVSTTTTTSCASGRPTSTSTPTDAARPMPKVGPTPTSTAGDHARVAPLDVSTSAPHLEELFNKSVAKYFGTMTGKDTKDKERTLYEAIQGFDELIQADDFNAKGEAFLYKAPALHELERHEDALKAFDKAADLAGVAGARGSMRDLIWHGKGRSLLVLGEYSEAVEAYEKAIEINPDASYTWRDKGAALLAMGRYGEAKSVLEKALSLDPDDWQTKLGLDLVEAKLKSD